MIKNTKREGLGRFVMMPKPCDPFAGVLRMHIFDISPLISQRIAVWPGDQSFHRNETLSFQQGHNLVLSSIQTTVHLGAHADAPIHYHPEGEDIASRSLSLYLGPCQVIGVSIPPGERIYPHHLPAVKAPRVLFKTGSFPNPDQWNSDFNSLSPELVNQLGQQDVILVGIDTPSVDPEQSKALESHQAIMANDMAVLEGLLLNEVSDGLYTLVALPLKMENADASPVRAVLVKDWPGP